MKRKPNFHSYFKSTVVMLVVKDIIRTHLLSMPFFISHFCNSKWLINSQEAMLVSISDPFQDSALSVTNLSSSFLKQTYFPPYFNTQLKCHYFSLTGRPTNGSCSVFCFPIVQNWSSNCRPYYNILPTLFLVSATFDYFQSFLKNCIKYRLKQFINKHC